MRILKSWFCRIEMHSFKPERIPGTFQHGRCRWCGAVGLVDSQGNLFATDTSSDPEEATP